MRIKKATFCDCGQKATRISLAYPVCERCYQLERIYYSENNGAMKPRQKSTTYHNKNRLSKKRLGDKLADFALARQ